MAIVLSGKSTCLICGKVLELEDEIKGFPAFLKRTHRLYRYSDSAMHRSCYDACPDNKELDRLFFKYRQIWDNRPRHLQTKEEIDAWGKAAFADFDKL